MLLIDIKTPKSCKTCPVSITSINNECVCRKDFKAHTPFDEVCVLREPEGEVRPKYKTVIKEESSETKEDSKKSIFSYNHDFAAPC